MEQRTESPIRLTVFTPAYNRAHTLPRTYDSLCKQSCKDFIWLVVDDGSSDHTAQLVKSWQQEDCGFEIRYIYKKNGGMHTAHNTAYEHISTELNTCVDSDDYMPPRAVELILEKWDQVKTCGYAGIIALDSDLEGTVLGGCFPDSLKDTTLCGYYASGGSGDKKLIYRTDVIRSVPPYPEFEGEKYVALAYKYRLIDQTHRLAVLNEVVCCVDYQPDGSSNTMFKQYLKNPRGFAFWRKVCMTYPESSKRLWIDCMHYVANCIIAHEPRFIYESPRKLRTVLMLPFGAMLMFYIKWKAKRS